MFFLSLEQVITLHKLIVSETGGSHGTRNLGAIESALAQPRQTFGGAELYPTLEEKAATLLRANGCDLSGSVDEQERVVLAVAAGGMNREDWTIWVRDHARPWEAEG